ncbi:MAG: hypothetical protein ACRDPA_17190 [Solirubrobacteraceae bacterium]
MTARTSNANVVVCDGSAAIRRTAECISSALLHSRNAPSPRPSATTRSSTRTVEGIQDVIRWRRRNREAIDLVLRSTHWPRDVTHVEEHVHMVRRLLGDRRRSFRNLPRLNALLRARAPGPARRSRRGRVGTHPARQVDGELLTV